MWSAVREGINRVPTSGFHFVHFSAQPEPFLSREFTKHRPYPSKSVYVDLKSGQLARGTRLDSLSVHRIGRRPPQYHRHIRSGASTSRNDNHTRACRYRGHTGCVHPCRRPFAFQGVPGFQLGDSWKVPTTTAPALAGNCVAAAGTVRWGRPRTATATATARSSTRR